MNTNYNIRKATIGDEQILAYIQTESWKAAFKNIIQPEELEQSTNLERATAMYKKLLDAKKFYEANGFYITDKAKEIRGVKEVMYEK